MKIYYNSATEPAPIVIDGEPPVDLSAELAAAVAERDAAVAAQAVLQGKIDAARVAAQAAKDADAAKTDGQDVLDALA